MSTGKPRNQWSELNDVTVIEAMRINLDSKHWGMCNEFIRDFIENQFRNLSPQTREDAAQTTMLSVYKGLSTFRYQSKFTLWLVSIARNSTITIIREQKKSLQLEMHHNESAENRDDETEISIAIESRTLEEIVLTKERIREMWEDIEEFIKEQRKSGRNRIILYKFLEGYSYDEIAQELGETSAVIGFVVRSFREYERHKQSYKPD